MARNFNRKTIQIIIRYEVGALWCPWFCGLQAVSLWNMRVIHMTWTSIRCPPYSRQTSYPQEKWRLLGSRGNRLGHSARNEKWKGFGLLYSVIVRSSVVNWMRMTRATSSPLKGSRWRLSIKISKRGSPLSVLCTNLPSSPESSLRWCICL